MTDLSTLKPLYLGRSKHAAAHRIRNVQCKCCTGESTYEDFAVPLVKPLHIAHRSTEEEARLFVPLQIRLQKNPKLEGVRRPALLLGPFKTVVGASCQDGKYRISASSPAARVYRLQQQPEQD